MKKRIITVLVLAALLLSIFTACGNGTDVLTSEDAQAVALEQAGLTKNQATDIHTHIVTENGIPCYNVHISSTKGDYTYLIAAEDGTVISGGEGSGH